MTILNEIATAIEMIIERGELPTEVIVSPAQHQEIKAACSITAEAKPGSKSQIYGVDVTEIQYAHATNWRVKGKRHVITRDHARAAMSKKAEPCDADMAVMQSNPMWGMF